MHATLRDSGWFHLPAAGEDAFFALTASLGSVVYETDVSVRKQGRGLVTSEKPLDFHTDHSRVEYVAWLCIAADEHGGETILSDAWKALALLSADDKKMLESVMLKEHAVFAGDLREYPLLSTVNGKLKCYYSFWLADDNMPTSHRRAFNAFRRAVADVQFHEFKLQCNDILIVDNARILHGRRRIKDPSRQLKRFWISSTPIHPTNEVHHANAECRKRPKQSDFSEVAGNSAL